MGSSVLRIGRHFQFEAPDGWEESREGTRWVYRGPLGQELIISASFVDGHGPLADRQEAEQVLLSNAMKAAREGASQEGLVNVIPLKPNEAVTELPCWSYVSETVEKDVSFVGAVLASGGGVLLATLEGPYGYEILETFRKFLRSVRRPTS
jgi:hypothetical protein